MLRIFNLFLIYTCISFLFSGCYKKDLEEFDSISSTRLTSELAVPLFYSYLTIRDSIPFQLPDLKLADTLKIDLRLRSYLDDVSIDHVSAIEFKLITENTFPIKGSLQLYFIDDTNTPVDSLFTSTTSTTQSNNNTTLSTTLIQLDKEKYLKIESSKKVHIKYTFSTSNYPINENNYFSVKAGLKFSIDYVKKW